MQAGQTLILDGALGTELLRRGCDCSTALWSAQANLANPELVVQIHRDYIAAGAQILTANTFRTTPRSYRRAGYAPVEADKLSWQSLHSAVDLARRAAGNKALVAGSIAPLEDCYQPQDFPVAVIAAEEFATIADQLIVAGVDLLLIETMGNIEEIRAVLDAMDQLDIPRWLSFITPDGIHLLDGTPLAAATALVSQHKVDVLLLNCTTLSVLLAGIAEITRHWSGLWGAYPNLGNEQPATDGTIAELVPDSEFQFIIRELHCRSAAVLGACCGARPEHIRIISEVL